MKGRDYSALSPQLRRFALALIIGAALFAPAHFAHQRAQGRWEKANDLFAAAQVHRARLGKVRETRRAYEDRFLRLREKGAIDANDADLWTATVKRVAISKGLSAFALEASAPAPFKPGLPGIKATVSGIELKLRFKLLHEGDLVRFFEELHTNAPGAVWPHNCVITPLNERNPTHGSPARANLEVTCLLTGLNVLSRSPAQNEERL